jgi:hypothetical protein
LLAVSLAAATAIVVGAVPAAADSGGGCRQTNNAYVCISVRTGTTGPLIADYYINVKSRGEYKGIAYVEQGGTAGDSCYNDWQVGVWFLVGGHSPVYERGKVCRSARTVVEFYDINNRFIYSAVSPRQYW